MKTSIISDLHLNKVSYQDVKDKTFTSLTFRAVDFMNAFEYMVDKNINEIKPDLVVIAGDIYDTYDPSNTIRAFFNQQVFKMVKAGIKIIILIGQHDICKRHHALQPLYELNMPQVKIIDKPILTHFKDYNLMLFPYPMQAALQRKTIKSIFDDFIKKAKKQIDDSPEYSARETIFMGHLGIRGAIQKTDSSGQNAHVNKEAKSVSVDDLMESNAKYIVLGDYHRHQTLKMEKKSSGSSSQYAMYTGSIERTDISEAEQEKGFILLDSEHEEIENYGKCRFIKYPNTRPMLDLKGTVEELNTKLEDLNNQHSNAIVRLTFETDIDKVDDFEVRKQHFEDQLKQKINPILVRSSSEINDPEEKEQAEELENEIMQDGNFSADDVVDVVSDMVKETYSDPNEQKILIEMLQDITQSQKAIQK